MLIQLEILLSADEVNSNEFGYAVYHLFCYLRGFLYVYVIDIKIVFCSIQELFSPLDCLQDGLCEFLRVLKAEADIEFVDLDNLSWLRYEIPWEYILRMKFLYFVNGKFFESLGGTVIGFPFDLILL